LNNTISASNLSKCQRSRGVNPRANGQNLNVQLESFRSRTLHHNTKVLQFKQLAEKFDTNVKAMWQKVIDKYGSNGNKNVQEQGRASDFPYPGITQLNKVNQEIYEKHHSTWEWATKFFNLTLVELMPIIALSSIETFHTEFFDELTEVYEYVYDFKKIVNDEYLAKTSALFKEGKELSSAVTQTDAKNKHKVLSDLSELKNTLEDNYDLMLKYLALKTDDITSLLDENWEQAMAQIEAKYNEIKFAEVILAFVLKEKSLTMDIMQIATADTAKRLRRFINVLPSASQVKLEVLRILENIQKAREAKDQQQLQIKLAKLSLNHSVSYEQTAKVADEGTFEEVKSSEVQPNRNIAKAKKTLPDLTTLNIDDLINIQNKPRAKVESKGQQDSEAISHFQVVNDSTYLYCCFAKDLMEQLQAPTGQLKKRYSTQLKSVFIHTLPMLEANRFKIVPGEGCVGIRVFDEKKVELKYLGGLAAAIRVDGEVHKVNGKKVIFFNEIFAKEKGTVFKSVLSADNEANLYKLLPLSNSNQASASIG
jgi:hypothetical protein